MALKTVCKKGIQCESVITCFHMGGGEERKKKKAPFPPQKIKWEKCLILMGPCLQVKEGKKHTLSICFFIWHDLHRQFNTKLSHDLKQPHSHTEE